MLLNRPLSINTQKDNLLTQKLESKIKSSITYTKAGVFLEISMI